MLRKFFDVPDERNASIIARRADHEERGYESRTHPLGLLEPHPQNVVLESKNYAQRNSGKTRNGD